MTLTSGARVYWRSVTNKERSGIYILTFAVSPSEVLILGDWDGGRQHRIPKSKLHQMRSIETKENESD